jgi:hypothetical protein
VSSQPTMAAGSRSSPIRLSAITNVSGIDVIHMSSTSPGGSLGLTAADVRLDDRSRSQVGERRRRIWRDRYSDCCDDLVGGAVAMLWPHGRLRTRHMRPPGNPPGRGGPSTASTQAGYFVTARRADQRVAVGHVVYGERDLTYRVGERVSGDVRSCALTAPSHKRVKGPRSAPLLFGRGGRG